MRSHHLIVQGCKIKLVEWEISCQQNIKDGSARSDICYGTNVTFVDEYPQWKVQALRLINNQYQTTHGSEIPLNRSRPAFESPNLTKFH